MLKYVMNIVSRIAADLLVELLGLLLKFGFVVNAEVINIKKMTKLIIGEPTKLCLNILIR